MDTEAQYETLRGLQNNKYSLLFGLTLQHAVIARR